MFKRIFASIAVLYGKQVHSETQSALIQQAVASNALSSAGTKVWIAGASSATGSWFLSNQFFGLVGALAAVIGVFVNIYFKRKETMIKENTRSAGMIGRRSFMRSKLPACSVDMTTMTTVTIYTTQTCMPCKMTKKSLKNLGIPFNEKPAEENRQMLIDMGMTGLPVVVTDDAAWSGFRPDLISKLTK